MRGVDVSAPRVWRVLATAWLCLLASQARAGAMSPCSNPTVFDADVQVHIFPFSTDKALSNEARALATLLQRHVLFAALKYPSIGVQELVDDHSPCGFRQVASRISSRLKPQQTAIFLSGRIFEQDGRIYLKNFVAVKAPKSKLAIQWKLADDAQATVTTQIPIEIDGFAPRTIPLSFLERLAPSQLQARRVHREPNEQSPFQELPDGTRDRYTFLVFEARDDWMRVRVMPFGVEGWIPAHALASGQAMKGEFPELYFVDALVGYFSMGGNGERDRRVLGLTHASFDQYLNVTEGRAEPDTRALALVLKGNARLHAVGAEWPTSTLSAARADYAHASAESPSWTPAQAHLLACDSLLCVRGACEGRGASLEAGYLEAIARDPLSAELVDGLGAYYQAAKLERLATGLSAESLQIRAQKVQGVQARMPTR
jgi:hypothetical protein